MILPATRINVLTSSRASFTSGDDTVKGSRFERMMRRVAFIALWLRDASCENKLSVGHPSISSLSSQPSVVGGVVGNIVASGAGITIRGSNGAGEKG